MHISEYISEGYCIKVKTPCIVCIVYWEEGVPMIRLKIKEVLQEKRVSQSKLSRLADVSLNTIQTMYHHPYHDPALSTLERIAKALHVEICDLYEVLSDETEAP